MPSLEHDALIELFRNRPALAPELLRDVLHGPVPAFDRVSVGDPTLSEIVPTEYRADLVLLLESTGGAKPRAALVVEAQLQRDPEKRRSWPVYLAGLRARLRCGVALLVVTADAAVAKWAAAPIPTGHPAWTLIPLVLGPGVVPLVTDEEEASRAPELAVLSVMVHGRGEHAVEVGRAALAAVRGLDDERGRLCADLVLLSVRETAGAILEAVMASGKWEYQSDFAKRYIALGRAEGKAEGRVDAILAVLAARHIAVPDDIRARIASCSELTVLDRWLARALTAASAGEVVSD